MLFSVWAVTKKTICAIHTTKNLLNHTQISKDGSFTTKNRPERRHSDWKVSRKSKVNFSIKI